MELTQQEKDRIIAEEKVRYEARKALKVAEGGSCQRKGCVCGCHSQGGGSCNVQGCGCGCHGQASPGCGKSWGCHCGGFWKGLILGLILSLVLGFICRHFYGWNHDGACFYGSSMMQNSQPSEAPGK